MPFIGRVAEGSLPTAREHAPLTRPDEGHCMKILCSVRPATTPVGPFGQGKDKPKICIYNISADSFFIHSNEYTATTFSGS